MCSTEIRCGQCRRKLAIGTYIELTIKCPRCGAMNCLKAESLPSERPRASSNEVNHD
ncbi:Com family DNA-binding transcriptional regulator [Chromobacterium vaccinii]|uniref:Com family DNA-binding transcriptional regulator n=1 Tax=Chromobacterium vaccinii TaxID=1108595 RepID=UPI003C7967AD